MVLETLGWGREPREDVSFVLEARLHFTQPTDVNWRNLFSVKMAPVSAILVTLGQNTLTPTLKFERYVMFYIGLVLIGAFYPYEIKRQKLTLKSYNNYLFCIFFGRARVYPPLFDYVAHFIFVRDVWIRSQRAAIASRRATNLATHLPNIANHLPT
jgi:hypothetical protein